MDSIEYKMKGMLLQDKCLSLFDKIKGEEELHINYWPTVTTLNMSRRQWGQGSVYEKYPDKLNFVLFRHVATNTIEYVTLLDLWHPSSATGHMTPPDSLPRSELVSVNVHALEIFSRHEQHIVELRLCSCVCSFGQRELKWIVSNSNKLKKMYLRYYESKYDFLEMLAHRDFELLHLETNVVDLNELTRWMQMLDNTKLFSLRCGVVQGGKLEDHDFDLPQCEVNVLQNVDVMSECRN